MRRRLVGLACLSLTATAGAVPASAAPCGRAAAVRSGFWFVATPPLPPHTGAHELWHGAGARLRTVAVDAADPRVVLVTDGVRVQRSDDGGCTWRQVYALTGAPGVTTPDGDVGEIRSMDVTRVGGRVRVLLLVQSVGYDYPQPVRTVVVRSDDGYTGWAAVADPLFVGVHDYARGPWGPVVRGTAQVAYAAMPSPTGAVAYFRSTDGGRTWALRTSPTDRTAPVAIVGFAVNPWNPAELWEWGGRWSQAGDMLTALRRSTDGGATWSSVDPWPSYPDDNWPGWVSADVAWPRRGGPARLIVLGDAPGDGDVPVAAWSGDGGVSWQIAVPPYREMSLVDAAVAHLSNGDAVLVLRNRLAYRVVHRGRAPRRADWLPLPKSPEEPGLAVVGYDRARASATTPGVVAVPTLRTVQLLTVRR